MLQVFLDVLKKILLVLEFSGSFKMICAIYNVLGALKHVLDVRVGRFKASKVLFQVLSLNIWRGILT